MILIVIETIYTVLNQIDFFNDNYFADSLTKRLVLMCLFTRGILTLFMWEGIIKLKRYMQLNKSKMS